MKEQAVEAEKEKQGLLEKKQRAAPMESPPLSVTATETASAADLSASPSESTDAPTLEQRVQELRRQVERLVKAPGGPLKSAPFHTASTMQSLPSGTEVLIIVSTPYWLGVETHEGQHGWMLRDDLGQLP
jgi:hypothetical protein